MRVKNNKATSDTWVGQSIEAGAEYDLEASEIFKWQTSDKVLADLTTGDLLIGDGSAYKSGAAQAVAFLMGVDTEPKDTAGRPITRGAVTEDGWHFDPEWIEVTTSTIDGFFNKSVDGADLGQCTVELFDEEDTLITTQEAADTACVKTVLTFTPTAPHQPIGASIYQKEVPAGDVRIYPRAYPGVANIIFGNGGINLRFAGTNESIKLDGRAVKTMPYYPGVKTWEFTLLHGAGVKHPLAIFLEIFNA